MSDEQNSNSEWVKIGVATDKLTADYVLNSLRDNDIPSAINSKSGFLGDVGLINVSSPFGGGDGAYEIIVIAERAEEAREIAKMIAGESWESDGESSEKETSTDNDGQEES